MATKLFLRTATSEWGSGTNDTRLNTVAAGWLNQLLSTTQGSSFAAISIATTTGPTNGLEYDTGSTGRAYISQPLDADVTISGSITWNIWAEESNMSANVAINGRLEVVDGATGTITLIDQTARTTELAVGASARAVNNFAETPGAGVACKRGDRLRVRIFGDDSASATMASGFTFDYSREGTASADGDSWVQLTENLTFVSEPAGTTIYPTDTASAVSTASVDREAWTSRGAGVQTDVRNTAAGWTAPLQVTDTAGGTVVDWFTKQLAAFTLGGAVRVNVRAVSSSASSFAVPRCEIARVASDGTSPTVWGAMTYGMPATGGIGTSEAAHSFLISGDDLAVSDGQRLRIRFYIDDQAQSAMAASQTVTTYYAGTSGGASGDTYLTFTQTLTEYTAAQTVTPTTAALVITRNIPTVRVNNIVTVPTAGGTGYVAAVLADSPVGYWRMGEASGSVLDSIGSSHGTATGTTRDVTGPLASGDDGAITFNGTSDKVNFGDVLDITVGSYEVWFKRGATQSTTQYFFSKGGYQPNLHFNTTNNLVVGYEDNNWLYGTAAITDTNWHHVVFTHPGGASSGLAKLYVDGVDVTTTLTGAALAANSSNLRLGAAYVDALYFHGSLDEAAIYNTVLSSARVLAHYNAGITAGGLVLTTYAPTIRQGVGAIPTTKALTLATFAPTVRTPILATPTTKAVVLTKYAPTVSTPVRATPTTVSLTVTRFAPTIYLHQRVTPTTKSLVATKYAPTVSTPERVTPTTKALALAAFAPVVTATSAQSVTPTAAALLLSSLTPSVTATAHQRVTPTTASLGATKYAPTVTAGADVAVVPSNAAVTLTKYAPTVTANQHVTVVPNAVSLITSPQVPTATASDHKRVTPVTAVLTATKYAPTVRTPILATPTTKALVATRYAPTVAVPQRVTPTTKPLSTASFAPTITNPQRYVAPTAVLAVTKYAPSVEITAASTIVVPNKSLTITRHIPSVSATAHLTVTPQAAALTTTKFAPTVSATSHQVVVPAVKSLTATRYAPTVTASSAQGIVPATKALTITKFAPTVSATAHIAVIPQTKVLQLVRFAPTVRVANLVRPAATALVLTTPAPIVTPTLNTLVRPAANHLTITRFAPLLEISGHAAFTPITTALLITTYAPTVETHSITSLPDLIYGFAVVAYGDSGSVGMENGGATVRSEGGGTAVLTSGPSARVTIR